MITITTTIVSTNQLIHACMCRNGSDFYSTQPWLNEAGGGGAGDARRHGGYAGSTGGSFGGEGRIVSNGVIYIYIYIYICICIERGIYIYIYIYIYI